MSRERRMAAYGTIEPSRLASPSACCCRATRRILTSGRWMIPLRTLRLAQLPAISPISWLDAKQPRPRERGGEAHESNEMECCRRAGDRSFSLRLPVRNSAPPGPGHRGDLPDTFGQLSYPKLTSSRFHLLLPRIGDRHRGRHIGTLSGVGWQIVDLQQISQSSVKSIIMHATVGAVTRRHMVNMPSCCCQKFS